MIETKKYTDSTTATGVSPLPSLSPKQQVVADAFSCLDDIEALMGGRNGPSIRLRALIAELGDLK